MSLAQRQLIGPGGLATERVARRRDLYVTGSLPATKAAETPNGAIMAFTVPMAALDASRVQVYLNGVLLDSDDAVWDYTVTISIPNETTQITFGTTAPAATDVIKIAVLARSQVLTLPQTEPASEADLPEGSG